MQRRGFTLVELLVVTAIGFIIALLASPPLFTWMTRQKVEQSGIQFLSDLKYARREAEIQGAVGIMPQDPVNNPTIIDTPIRRIYVALNTQENEYRIYRWQDEDMDGVPDAGEFSPNFQNPNNDGVLREGELGGVEFARSSDLNKNPCTNNPSNSTDPIVNINSCPVVDGVFTEGEYCIRFNSQGFYEGMDNAKIFLFREASRLGQEMYEAYGIALNVTGALQMCRWNCDDWNELGQCLAGEWKRVR